MQFHIVAAPIYIPLTVHKDSFFSTSLPKVLFVVFLIIAILTANVSLWF